MDTFIGTICAFGFNFAPRDWAFCQGQILPISQNAALFSLLGTAYGGNGSSTFGLPNLQGCVAISQGSNGQSNYTMGETGGSTSVTLTTQNLPAHSHTISFSLTGTNRGVSATSPVSNIPAQPIAAVGNYNTAPGVGVYMKPPSISLGNAGGNVPISIQDPCQVINYCIALYGLYPPRQ